MESILERIIQQKQKEVIRLRQATQPERIKNQKRSFIERLQKANEIAVIAEFKRASPSKGIINEGIEPQEQAVIYENAGAAAISVLTDETFFKGSYSDLRAIRNVVDIPVLCKDFIIDPCQIDHALANGADIILLIVAALEEEQLKNLFHYAKSLDLDVLVEVHNQEEVDVALETGAKLIGVNNRDLKTFDVSLKVTEALAAKIKASGAYLISESGIHKKEDVECVRNAGANGILVGESLMKSKDITKALSSFRLPLVGGIMK